MCLMWMCGGVELDSVVVVCECGWGDESEAFVAVELDEELHVT